MFVPLKVAFPNADIPLIEMSVERGLDPALHVAAGRALAPLRKEGVLILGSGMSFHNMRAYGDPRSTPGSQAFDQWLAESMELDGPQRAERLTQWADAPSARFAHPPAKEEHLLPLMVAAGAAEGEGAEVGISTCESFGLRFLRSRRGLTSSSYSSSSSLFARS